MDKRDSVYSQAKWPGSTILVAYRALIANDCGTIYNVEIATEKGAVELNFNWDR